MSMSRFKILTCAKLDKIRKLGTLLLSRTQILEPINDEPINELANQNEWAQCVSAI